MGASAIEQIYLPNCLCASGIKPSKFRKSGADWVFKLARSTYAQADKISPRTTTSRHRRTALVPSAGPGHHRERRRAPPRADTSERPRCFPRTPALPNVEQPQSASPGAFREHPSSHHSIEPCHSPEPCSSTPAPTR